ncbi:imidazole glycerol phosphate synthase subunit hisF [Asticcacaulis biprosthecium C19]|uniref:Imidazole glycerol phosphate synthase subunit HisF n=1 Tax=Asticcacaulis biprosthecium C19 TaxID=715226 RepID=F4QL59_9CAUL|nr:imidazole glycerol phosphate synthase subunit HisF [Asticcacaulis biprosthecium]EGF93434.1 imidazole glycerol phosphate synthase subunit hisF [Asticcacaulis biprosthecium C19]
MLARRIIPCLDVKDGKVVKGVQFVGHEVLGDAVDMALRYRDEGADELVLYDITASSEGRTVDYNWVRDIARALDIPFCVAGGIRSAEQAVKCLNSGADKVSINSPALERPDLINELAEMAGSQCVVVGIDSREMALPLPKSVEHFSDKEGQPSKNVDYYVHQYSGDPDKIRQAGRRTLDWVVEARDRGAGEIVLNCMNQDGVRKGYDLKQLRLVRDLLDIPLVASGGAGSTEHFVEVFDQADVSGALAASVFHKKIIHIPDLKRDLRQAGIAVRL